MGAYFWLQLVCLGCKVRFAFLGEVKKKASLEYSKEAFSRQSQF